MKLRAFAGPLLLGTLLLACEVEPEQGARACFPVATETPRRGGWDGNGVSLQGREAQRSQGATSGVAMRRAGMEVQGIYLGIGDLDGVRLEVASTGAEVRLEDGRPVADGEDDLRGVELRATTRDLRHFAVAIAGSAPHPDAPEVETFALLVDGQPVCEPGDDGVFVDGRWDDRAAHVDSAGALAYACKSGVITKCVAWGYAPWSVGADVHQACTRMARADYCGDGVPWTMEGTMIDAYDDLGVQDPLVDPELEFEAAWGTDGAVCVAHRRWDVVDHDGAAILPSCFESLPRCDDLADAPEAALANASTPRTIAACE